MSNCELCGGPMPPGEEMFKYHGYSGPCPKQPQDKEEPASSALKPMQVGPGGTREDCAYVDGYNEALKLAVAWREKWINDKGLRDQIIAELEARCASIERERSQALEQLDMVSEAVLAFSTSDPPYRPLPEHCAMGVRLVCANLQMRAETAEQALATLRAEHEVEG